MLINFYFTQWVLSNDRRSPNLLKIYVDIYILLGADPEILFIRENSICVLQKERKFVSNAYASVLGNDQVLSEYHVVQLRKRFKLEKSQIK